MDETKRGRGRSTATAEAPKEEVKAADPIVVEKHANIYEALSAFQGENITLERTKEFGKETDKMHFWYTPLDEVLKKVRPSLAKHGLSFVHTAGGKDNTELVCVLYHETYSKKNDIETLEKRSYDRSTSEGARDLPTVVETHYGITEENVIRSLPVTVARKGDMKEIGKDSTYARRYTLAEVLGIAPDEDNDIAETKEKLEAAQSAMFERVKKGILGAKNEKELTASANVLDQNKTQIKNNQAPTLGLDEKQLDELIKLVVSRKGELNRAGVGKGNPGENKDNGGEATLPLETTTEDTGNGVPPIEG